MIKIVLKKEEWLEPLQKIMNIVDKKQARPILSHVLLKGEADKLHFISTDTDMELRSCVPVADGSCAGLNVTVPGKKLLDICRSVPDNSLLELMVRSGGIDIVCCTSRFSLASFSGADFPLMAIEQLETEVRLPGQVLLELIKKTAFAIPQQDVRKYLNGLLLELNERQVVALATDGHRLAIQKSEALVGLASTAQIIVPRKAVFELQRWLSQSDAEIRLELSSNYISVTTEYGRLVSKLISGKFPNYSKIIPSKGELQAVVNCAQLRQALVRVGIVSSELLRGVRFTLHSGQLTLDANNPEHEEAIEELEVTYTGPDLDILFNLSYLVDIVNVLDETRNVVLFFSESGGSVILEEQGAREGCLYVLMPIRQ